MSSQPLASMSSEVIHHHYLPGVQRSGQQAFHIRFEDSGGSRSSHGHGRSHPLRIKARKERCVLAADSRNLEEGSLAYGRVGLQRSQGGVGAHLIHEYQPSRIDVPDLHAPEYSQELVSFCCPLGSFFRLLWRRPTARQTVSPRSLLHPTHCKQELSPLGVGGPRPLFEVFHKEPSRLLV
jgi:hypothetical protein